MSEHYSFAPSTDRPWLLNAWGARPFLAYGIRVGACCPFLRAEAYRFYQLPGHRQDSVGDESGEARDYGTFTANFKPTIGAAVASCKLAAPAL